MEPLILSFRFNFFETSQYFTRSHSFSVLDLYVTENTQFSSSLSPFVIIWVCFLFFILIGWSWELIHAVVFYEDLIKAIFLFQFLAISSWRPCLMRHKWKEKFMFDLFRYILPLLGIKSKILNGKP